MLISTSLVLAAITDKLADWATGVVGDLGLAGLALLHTHHLNLEPMVKVLTIAQQQTLSTALGLDFQAHGTDATWPSLLGRRIVAKMVPGSTPKKRKRTDNI